MTDVDLWPVKCNVVFFELRRHNGRIILALSHKQSPLETTFNWNIGLLSNPADTALKQCFNVTTSFYRSGNSLLVAHHLIVKLTRKHCHHGSPLIGQFQCATCGWELRFIITLRHENRKHGILAGHNLAPTYAVLDRLFFASIGPRVPDSFVLSR